jgi:hypothetical protein
VLGPNPSLRFVSGNTALPPTEDSPPASQPTHNDADFDHPSIPFALVINVPLVTMKEENGSTEIWLGTHDGTTIADQEGAHGDRASGRIKKHLLDARREVRPPSQPLVKKGSIIVRDLRLWHGGKPNLSDTPRVMLAMSKSPSLRKVSLILTMHSPLCTLVPQPDASRICGRTQRSTRTREDRIAGRCNIRAGGSASQRLLESSIRQRVRFRPDRKHRERVLSI